jgi:hypothetical protein
MTLLDLDYWDDHNNGDYGVSRHDWELAENWEDMEV